MPKFVATFRATYDADDDVAAAIIADQIRLNAEQDLDTDDSDDVECTQVTSSALELAPDETMHVLRHARNLLIKTRIKECFNLAFELDKTIYQLQFRDSPAFIGLSGYDWDAFMEVATQIVTLGKEPPV